MKIIKKFGDRIYLEWIDACERPGWKDFDGATTPPEETFCKTNGFFLKQDKDFITIAHTIGHNIQNDMMGVLHIPKAWLKKVR